MDHKKTPVLDAIDQYRRDDNYSFALPGHRFGRGLDDRTAAVLSRSTFEADVIMAKQSVSEAEELMADAVGARHAIFTTAGSSISIHTAMLTVTGPGKKILVDRNVHKSVVASLILAGADPVWLRPRWDAERQISHPATASDVDEMLTGHPDVSAVLMITPTEYGTGADVRGIADLCHRRGIPLLVDEAWGRTSRSTRACRPPRSEVAPTSRCRACTRPTAVCARRRRFSSAATWSIRWTCGCDWI